MRSSHSIPYSFAAPELRRAGGTRGNSPAWIERIKLDQELVLTVSETQDAALSIYKLESDRLTLLTSSKIEGDGAVSIALIRTDYGAQVFIGL